MAKKVARASSVKRSASKAAAGRSASKSVARKASGASKRISKSRTTSARKQVHASASKLPVVNDVSVSNITGGAAHGAAAQRSAAKPARAQSSVKARRPAGAKKPRSGAKPQKRRVSSKVSGGRASASKDVLRGRVCTKSARRPAAKKH